MSRRARLAAGLLATVAVVALASVLAGFWLAARAGAHQPPIITRVDQLGDRVAIISVDGAGATGAAHASRVSALHWVLLALGLGLLPTAGVSWWLVGRLPPAEPRDPPVPEARSAPLRAAVDETGGDGETARDRDRERRRQLQDVVHELRTPLAVAATNLDLAVSSPGLGEELAARLGAARRGVERLARTVDDLSTHGRLAVGEDSGLVDLAAEVGVLAADQAGPARLRGVSIATLRPERLAVAADRAALHTAVANLLANAVRLAPSGSLVEVGCGTAEDWAWIAVRDEGPGLAPDDHERAFHRYWRGRYETDRDDGFADDQRSARGLGLTIARQVTEAQGGHVTVDSVVGVGSTFVVWLPRSRDARTARVVAADGVHHRIDPMPARPTASHPAPKVPVPTPAGAPAP